MTISESGKKYLMPPMHRISPVHFSFSCSPLQKKTPAFSIREPYGLYSAVNCVINHAVLSIRKIQKAPDK